MKIYRNSESRNILFKEAKRKRFYGSGYVELYNRGKDNVITINRNNHNMTIETSAYSDIFKLIKELKDKYGLVGSYEDYFYNVDEYYDINLNGYVDYKGQRAFVNLGLFFENSDDSLAIDDAEEMDDLRIVDSNLDMYNHFDRW